MTKVFLGGTCNDSSWRDELIPMLNIDYFNPLVQDWNEEAQANEIHQRNICDYCLYVITPKMTGTYAIAEAVDDSNKRPYKTIFFIKRYDAGYFITDGQFKSLQRVGMMIRSNGGLFCETQEEIIKYLNGME